MPTPHEPNAPIPPRDPNRYWWLPNPSRSLDLYGAFRAEFSLCAETLVRLDFLGAHAFRLWLDGEEVAEGPVRFEPGHPEFQQLVRRLSPGRHVAAALVHAEGVSTRLLRGDVIPPFFCLKAKPADDANDSPSRDGDELRLLWRCTEFSGYAPSGVRINPQLGWIEWCDTSLNPAGWQESGFDDSKWEAPRAVHPQIASPLSPSCAPVQNFASRPRLLAQGELESDFFFSPGGSGEDLVWGFYSRELSPAPGRANGLWRRYDLGRVCLFRPRFRMELPAGAGVEFACAETLTRGRVSPHIALSCGASANLDHYVARGGIQEFTPLTPKGGRYLEVHVSAPPEKVRFLAEEVVQRSYFGDPEGAFACEDEQLNRIWRLGVDTLRGCAEDAIIDNPTRERGQWTGDVVSVGLDLAAAAWPDLRLLRRGLRQSAWCAREDGLVAGLCPGGVGYLSTYALQWVSACVRFVELGGEREFLCEMFPHAERNLAVFEKHFAPQGLEDVPGSWRFIDWGYKPPAQGPDLAYNLHYLAALRAMVRWCALLQNADRQTHYERLEQRLCALLRARLTDLGARGEAGWEEIGYHSAALSLGAGILNHDQQRAALACVKRHILSCFPNDVHAPRQSAPERSSRRLITPYFAHFAFPPLLEHGEADFVMEQYRACWGWALCQGCTTMLEVFNTNWSHCHQWSCCPTWQLTRYVLGLHPRFDLGRNHFELKLHPGSLGWARGRVCLPGENGRAVEVSWRREGVEINYEIAPPEALQLHMPGQSQPRQVRAKCAIRMKE